MQDAVRFSTDLEFIAAEASRKEEENDHFLRSLNNYDNELLDTIAHKLNGAVSVAVDCTQCGNCCKQLVINVSAEEAEKLGPDLGMATADAKEKYIEKSLQGNYFINTIPCHFLADNKCTIYQHRFTECRDFPHLHKPGFRARFSGTLMHYGRCPIIYNVVESMKTELGFFL